MVGTIRNRQRIFGGDTMRIVHEDGKLFISLTKKEAKAVQDNFGSPVEIHIGNLEVLLADITEAQISHSRWQRIEEELSTLSYRKKK